MGADYLFLSPCCRTEDFVELEDNLNEFTEDDNETIFECSLCEQRFSRKEVIEEAVCYEEAK